VKTRLTLYATGEYKKDIKRLVKRGWDMTLLDAVVDQLQRRQPLPDRYRNHLLSGDRVGFYDCHIRPDWVLLYQILEDKLVLVLIETGSHSDLDL
jgi:mRNA interferase YafQ